MKNVFLVYNMNTLKKVLNSIGALGNNDLKYFCYNKDFKAENLLKKNGYKGVFTVKKEENKFIKEYVDMIGRMSMDCNGRMWWATNMSSKNRFTSKLSVLLNEFLITVDVIQREKCNRLIIYNPSLGMEDSLKKAVKDIKIDVVVNLEDYFNKGIIKSLRFCFRVLSLFYSAAAIILKSFYVRMMLGTNFKNIRNPLYVVKTFIYNSSFDKNGNYKDTFFGVLPEYLKNKGEKILIYANILGDYLLCIQKIKKCHSYIVIPIEYFLSFRDILSGLFRILFHRFKIKKDALFFGFDVSRISDNELDRTFNDIPYFQFLHYYSTKNLTKTLKIKTFLMTYENNPWEKMCIIAIRKYSKETNILGYQHAAFPKASLNMFISKVEQDMSPLPDKVFTTGETPKKILERYSFYKSDFIESVCGLRFEKFSDKDIIERKKTGDILVALEGTLCEAVDMANYVLGQLKDDNRYSIILRPHPSLSMKSFMKRVNYNLYAIKNVKLSNGYSIKDDIESADMIVYFGSTVAFIALAMGKPAIHVSLKYNHVLNYDTLFECAYFKREALVAQKDSLGSIIDSIYRMEDKDYYSEQKMARAYVKDYFYPVDGGLLEKFLFMRK